MKDVCLVVPSIREDSLINFINKWKDIGLFSVVDLYVIEDNPTKTFNIDCVKLPVSAYYWWKDIERELGDKAWVIPRRSDTVRSFGYLMAYRARYKYIMTLDDDCYPPTEEDGVVYADGPAFVAEHLKFLNNRTRWFNTLDNVKPRGIPYFNVGNWSRNLINHGLWTNVLDYDAPTQLVAPKKEEFDFSNRIVPFGSYFPMCGMNVAWKREATVLMYHLLMGTSMAGDKYPFDRFGDIWCGVIAKKICDAQGFTISSGMPYIRHERASNPFTNLKKEAPGLEVNEKFWEYVDFANVGHQGDLAYSYYKMGEHIVMFDDFKEYKEYFKNLGEAMKTWSELIQKTDV